MGAELTGSRLTMGARRFMFVCIWLVVAACTDVGSTREPRTLPSPTSTTSIDAVTPPAPELTFPPQADPHYYSFESTLDCNPDAHDADLQVVQAFFTAYNERDLERLRDLVAPEFDELWDPSGLPHVGSASNNDLSAWAEEGWAVDDRFELVLLVSYGRFAGSDIILIRRNNQLAADGIDELVVGFKVPSSGCVITRLVGNVDTRAPVNCRFSDVYEDRLRSELSPDWEIPSLCRR